MFGQARAFISGLACLLVTQSVAAQDWFDVPPMPIYQGATTYELSPAQGLLFTPDKPGPHPVVILMHGCMGFHEGLFEWVALFAAHDYAVMLVDSYGPRGITANCGRQALQTTEVLSIDDVRGALSILLASDSIDPQRIFALGWSRGGNLALEISKTRRDDAVLAHLAGVVAFYPSCYGARLTTGFSNPVLILTGSEDIWLGASICTDFTERAGAEGNDVRLHIYPGATHGFDCDAPGEWYLAEADATMRCSPDAYHDAKARVIAFFDELGATAAR